MLVVIFYSWMLPLFLIKEIQKALKKKKENINFANPNHHTIIRYVLSLFSLLFPE